MFVVKFCEFVGNFANLWEILRICGKFCEFTEILRIFGKFCGFMEKLRIYIKRADNIRPYNPPTAAL